jgi:hypothetical protein
MAAPHWIQRLKEERWNWIYYGAVAALTGGCLIYIFRWYAILAAPVLAGLWVVYWRTLRHRHPQLSLTEIGEIEMEIPEFRPSGAPSPKNQQRAQLIIYGLFLLAFLAGAFDDLLSDRGDIGIFAIKASLVLLYGFVMYVSRKAANIHLVVAESGLFQLVDPSRPWLRACDAYAWNQHLVSRKLYGWDEVERFHWSRHRRKGYALHLSVHQPNFSSPQLISFQLRSLSDPRQQELDQIFHQHIPSPAESRQPATV